MIILFPLFFLLLLLLFVVSIHDLSFPTLPFYLPLTICFLQIRLLLFIIVQRIYFCLPLLHLHFFICYYSGVVLLGWSLFSWFFLWYILLSLCISVYLILLLVLLLLASSQFLRFLTILTTICLFFSSVNPGISLPLFNISSTIYSFFLFTLRSSK